jgi:CrcB protein
MSYLLVGIGGALGAMLRYFVSGLMPAAWGTLVINVAGSVAMGLLAGLLARFLPAGQAEIRLFAAIGVLGGFTTFSAFSLDAVTLWQRGELLPASLYVLLSVALSIAGLVAGLWLARIAA